MTTEPTPPAPSVPDRPSVRRTGERVAVAPGVELAIDRWPPGDNDGRSSRSAVPRPDGPRPRRRFLLVHGLASNARLWDGVAADLAGRGHEVITVDLRGHGRSSKPDDGYDIPTIAGDLARLIELTGLERPVVAGQSWGGNIVLELAAAQPERVAAVACVDGGWLDPQAAFADWEACLAALAPPRLAGRPLAEVEGHIRAAHPDWPEAGLAGTLANFEVRPDGTIAPWLTYERHLAVLRGMWAWRPAARYPDIRVPVLLIPVEPPATARAFDPQRKRAAVAAAQAALSRSEVHWFRGDHDIHAQRPAAVAALLAELADAAASG